jgi:eukaryotic-like serine/threonine-protein kinase
VTLAPGARLGPYEITAKLGEGGMGVVWKAKDFHLGREVALKVLPEGLTSDPERTARFEREAKLLASLNHPNIAQIYGLETSGETRALVMELVEGPTLAERLEKGSLPLDESLSIARQIAEALEEAHEKGIIHRDLKPQNIKASIEGRVKVLDFGLAKALDPVGGSSPSASQLAQSPTLTLGATVQGVILGTAAYMSPEQAAGGVADRRADIWSFGVVLYEMLCGRRLFDGETVSHVLAGVLKEEPDFSALPDGVPRRVRNLLRRCLRKRPRERLQAIGDARVVLEEVLADPRRGDEEQIVTAPAVAPSRLPWFAVAVAGVAAVAFAALWLTAGSGELPARSIHAALAAPEGTALGDAFALSPDGRRIALQTFDLESGLPVLWLRDLDRGEARRLGGTEGADLPFWSPDGARLGFFADGKLKRIDPAGGPAQAIADAPTPRGGTWGPDGRIVFSPSFRTGLSIVPASGGAVRELTTLDEARGEKSHRFPVFLPGGERILFLAQTAEAGAKEDASRIEALDLASGERTPLVTVNSSPLHAPQGHLLYWRDGALLAQRFDADALRVAGDGAVIASGVGYNQNEQALATVSAEGTLVVREGSLGNLASIVWLDRNGLGLGVIRERENFGSELALSHDGARLVVGLNVSGQGATDLWIYDLERAVASRLTFEEGGEAHPVWSRDDRTIYYANDRRNDGVLFRRAADGTGAAEELGTTESGMWPHAVSRDERWVVVGDVGNETGLDLLRYDLETKQLEPLVETPFRDDMASLAPDDRLLAYASERSGRWEIYVQALGGTRGTWQVSNSGGQQPRWRADGRELFFFAPPDRLYAVAVEPGEVPRFSAPRELFRFPLESYDVAPDGQRFVVLRRGEGGSGRPLTLVTSWTARLPRR